MLKVTFLGTGTSQGVPVIACPCDVCASKDPRDNRLRTSILIETNGKTFVVDTGPDFRQQMLRANVKTLDAVLFTHEHKDHIAGLDDIRAFNFVLGKKINVYASHRVQQAIRREFSYIFASEKYPGVPEIEMFDLDGNTAAVEDVPLTVIDVMHLRLPVLGFRFNDFTYITDANHIDEGEKEKMRNSKVLVLNALRLQKHVSHFNLAEAIELINELKPEMAYLTHISHQMGLHNEVEKKLPSNIRIAYDGLQLSF